MKHEGNHLWSHALNCRHHSLYVCIDTPGLLWKFMGGAGPIIFGLPFFLVTGASLYSKMLPMQVQGEVLFSVAKSCGDMTQLPQGSVKVCAVRSSPLLLFWGRCGQEVPSVFIPTTSCLLFH